VIKFTGDYGNNKGIRIWDLEAKIHNGLNELIAIISIISSELISVSFVSGGKYFFELKLDVILG
jgi:hypothetical protein